MSDAPKRFRVLVEATVELVDPIAAVTSTMGIPSDGLTVGPFPADDDQQRVANAVMVAIATGLSEQLDSAGIALQTSSPTVLPFAEDGSAGGLTYPPISPSAG